jgi:phosphatidyl-myo-inositol alpha-mannosyltransferase
MRIGLACPYTWDVPGGVQAHVRDLAEALIDLGHDVSVITPVDDETTLPDYAVDAGRALPIRYNGSVSRILLGPVSTVRVRRWLRDGHFDVLHVHEPTAPSVSWVANMLADGPIVATFHTANPRSRMLNTFASWFQPSFEKLRARIAVSEAARRTIVEHLGADAVLIPNGVAVESYATAPPLADFPPNGATIAFLGRIDEPRKGLDVLLEALPAIAAHVPEVRLLVAGPGDVDDVAERLPDRVRDRVHFLGLVSEEDKRRVFHSADAYCAPNTGQESFGIVLLEAMAAGTPVVASDIDAFRRVLDDGRAGRLFSVGEPLELAAALIEVLTREELRTELSERGRQVVGAYDWRVVASDIVTVYETVMEVDGVTVDERARVRY